MADGFTPRFVDLVRNTTTTAGTGNFVLGAAVSGFTSLAAAIQPGESFYYSAIGVDRPNEREVGRGTMQPDGTISRAPIGGTLTNFSGGTKTIALIAAAEWFEKIQAGGGAGGSAPAGVGLAATRAMLCALTDRTRPVLLHEAGREGIFLFDSSDCSAEVAADPQEGIHIAPDSDRTGATGAWVRQHGGTVTPFMFGAVDCTGTPRSATEVVTDCSDALEGMWGIVKHLATVRKIGVTMDLSACQGLGISRTWTLLANEGGEAMWNTYRFKIRWGRLVAMAAMEAMLHINGDNFDAEGMCELYGGVTARAATYAQLLPKYGIIVENTAGSNLGHGLVYGVRRHGMKFGTAGSNIPVNLGYWKFVKCGNVWTSATRFKGNYSAGAWQNAPAHNGSILQRHLMTLTPDAGVSVSDLEVGDTLSFNGDTELAIVREIVSSDATTVTVKVWPYVSVEAAGTFDSLHGGGCEITGPNLANTIFEGIEVFSCSSGLRYSALYAPTINTLLVEATRLAVQLGINFESMEGINIPHYHIESVFWSVVDVGSCFGARFGTASNLEGSARGKFDKILRLVSHSASGSGGVFTSSGKVSPRGITFEWLGGDIHLPSEISTKGNNLGGLGALGFWGNNPDTQQIGPFKANAFTFNLQADRSLADLSTKHRIAPFGPIYGDGPDGGPTGNIVFQIVASQAGMTVNGAASYTIAPGNGAIQGIAIYEPPNPIGTDLGNWRIFHWRVNTTGRRISAPVTADATAARGLVLADAETYIRFTGAAAVTVTVPTNAAQPFPIGTVIELEQAGAGAVSVAAAGGVTVNSRGGDLQLAGQYAVAALKKVAADTWTLTGDL